MGPADSSWTHHALATAVEAAKSGIRDDYVVAAADTPGKRRRGIAA